MSRRCQVTGKTAMVGNKVSHSNRKTKRRFERRAHTDEHKFSESNVGHRRAPRGAGAHPTA